MFFFALVFFIVIFDEECLSATKRGVPSFCPADETLAIKKFEKPCLFQLVSTVNSCDRLRLVLFSLRSEKERERKRAG